MKYFSTNGNSPMVNFKDATIRGQAPDKGLYFPEVIPVLPEFLRKHIGNDSKEEIGFQVMRPYVGDSIPENDLFRIVSETVNFDFPLVNIHDNISSLELFHGPTLAFKDVGARFMSRCLGFFSRERSEKIIVLVATSGDTGGAVANGFLDVEGVDVVILYPSGKVSSVQEKQLTTLGSNIHALEVNGNFDDCQRMVKFAFTHKELNAHRFLTSANSINIARWLPQQLYYFYAWKQWVGKPDPVISVPSGNFGNICAGLLAWRSGLPVKRFIAACNANDTVPHFLKTGVYESKPAVATMSNAMDVGDPSNFVRMLELFHHETRELNKMVSAYSISDNETRETIRSVYRDHKYLLDPHGAVAYLGLLQYLESNPEEAGILLETAHPVKFYDVVEPVTGEKVQIPESVRSLMSKDKNSMVIEAENEALIEMLKKI